MSDILRLVLVGTLGFVGMSLFCIWFTAVGMWLASRQMRNIPAPESEEQNGSD